MNTTKVIFIKSDPDNVNNKSQLGQFMTTNSDYILQGFDIPKNIPIKTMIEPFTGNGDLIVYAKEKLFTNLFTNDVKFECYDIEPNFDGTIKRDTLLDPPSYTNKYVITNPPYLARNKSTCKKSFDVYKVNDLYKCFIKEITTNICIGGILIIPLNFWCSIRKMDVDLRKKFMKVYKIVRINVFENKVFDDTGYCICAFQFIQRQYSVPIVGKKLSDNIPFHFFPNGKVLSILLNDDNDYTVGGELYKLEQTSIYKISRLILGDTPNTNILVKCIDSSSNLYKDKISLSIVGDEDIFYDSTPNKSARTFATLVITPQLSLEQQRELVDSFNRFFLEKRRKYNSLFMSNYREGNRKRISFSLVYTIVGYLLDQM